MVRRAVAVTTCERGEGTRPPRTRAPRMRVTCRDSAAAPDSTGSADASHPPSQDHRAARAREALCGVGTRGMFGVCVREGHAREGEERGADEVGVVAMTKRTLE